MMLHKIQPIVLGNSALLLSTIVAQSMGCRVDYFGNIDCPRRMSPEEQGAILRGMKNMGIPGSEGYGQLLGKLNKLNKLKNDDMDESEEGSDISNNINYDFAGRPYFAARRDLLAQGYIPAPLNNADACAVDYEHICRYFPETIDCGHGLLLCDFAWTKGSASLVVRVNASRTEPDKFVIAYTKIKTD